MNRIDDWMQGIELPPLLEGKHESPADGLCAMEMVAFIERLPHSDAPPCTCPVIAAYVRGINDAMTTRERARLLPYLPRLVDTVSPEYEQARAEYLAWEAITRFAPIGLRAAGLNKLAHALESFDHALGLRAASSAAAMASGARASAAADAASLASGASTSVYASTSVRAAAAAYVALVARASDDAQPCVGQMLAVLDGVLAIGPQSRGFTRPQRAAELARLV